MLGGIISINAYKQKYFYGFEYNHEANKQIVPPPKPPRPDKNFLKYSFEEEPQLESERKDSEELSYHSEDRL